MLVLLGVIWFAWVVSSAAMQFLANFERLQIFRTWTVRLLATVLFPYAVPATVVALVFFADSITPFIDEMYYGEKLANWKTMWIAGIIEYFDVSLGILFSGGVWDYQTKSGERDRRYKYNQFHPTFDDHTKQVALRSLYIPGLIILLLVVLVILNAFLEKKA